MKIKLIIFSCLSLLASSFIKASFHLDQNDIEESGVTEHFKIDPSHDISMYGSDDGKNYYSAALWNQNPLCFGGRCQNNMHNHNHNHR